MAEEINQEKNAEEEIKKSEGERLSRQTKNTFTKASGGDPRGFSFERRKRLPYLLQKGLSKPGRISYDVLRRAAASVHVARICITVLKEKVSKTGWTIKAIDINRKADPRQIEIATELFKHPNKNSETFRTFLDKILEDLLVLDAVAIEKVRYPDGRLAELHYLDAATVRPVFDEHGNQDIPVPIVGRDEEVRELPVSYVQVINSNPWGGREAGDLVAAWPKKDFIYFNMHPQGNMNSFGYGLSPIESVIGVVANILNADNFNGTYFEEGSFPPALIQLVANMDERELMSMREYMYTELEGRFHRPAIIAGPGEIKVLNLKDITQRDMQFMEYMKFMSRLLSAAFGLSPQDIGITEDLNRATSEVQKDLSQQKGYQSILHLFKEVFNQEILWNDFGFKDLEFSWVAEDNIDLSEASQIYDIALKNGSMTLNEVRERIGFAPFEDWANRPMLLTNSGYIPAINKTAESTGEKQKEEFNKKFKKSVYTNDGYRTWVDDRGYGQPFIFENILTGEGFAIKPPIAVNLLSQKMEEELTNALADRGLNVARVKRITETNVLNRIINNNEVKKEFIDYQNMEPAYDSEKWKAKFGGSRKFPYYMVSQYIDGKNLKDTLLLDDMKRSPESYKQAIVDLANLWLAEKDLILGDRRADQYVITSDKRGWGFDYQFKGNQSRWEGTKDSIFDALETIPELQKYFVKLITQKKRTNLLSRLLNKLK